MYWSPSPALIAWKAMRIVCSDDEQKRLSVSAGDVMVDPGDQPGVAAEVEALLALVVRGAPHDVDGLGEVDVGVALLERDERHGGEVVGAHVLERSLHGTTDGRADGVDDDGLRHVMTPV